MRTIRSRTTASVQEQEPAGDFEESAADDDEAMKDDFANSEQYAGGSTWVLGDDTQEQETENSDNERYVCLFLTAS